MSLGEEEPTAQTARRETRDPQGPKAAAEREARRGTPEGGVTRSSFHASFSIAFPNDHLRDQGEAGEDGRYCPCPPSLRVGGPRRQLVTARPSGPRDLSIDILGLPAAFENRQFPDEPQPKASIPRDFAYDNTCPMM